MSGTFQHFDNRLRYSLAGYMRFNDQVNEFRQCYCNVGIHGVSFLVLAQKLSIFMCTRIPCLSDGCPNNFFARVEVQAFDALVKVWSGATKVIAKTLKGDTKQDAGRPWRIVQNFLGFVVWFFDLFRHVCGGRNATRLWPHELILYEQTEFTTVYASTDMNFIRSKALTKTIESYFFVTLLVVVKLFDSLISKDVFNNSVLLMLATCSTVRTNECFANRNSI